MTWVAVPITPRVSPCVRPKIYTDGYWELLAAATTIAASPRLLGAIAGKKLETPKGNVTSPLCLSDGGLESETSISYHRATEFDPLPSTPWAVQRLPSRYCAFIILPSNAHSEPPGFEM